MTDNPITAALRSNVERATSKAGRKLAQDELDRYLARKQAKPHTPSPFVRFVEALKP
jgi:hypothetical protein